MKIPELIDYSPELREAIRVNEALIARERETSANVRVLRARKANGEIQNNDKDSRVALILNGESIPANSGIDAQLANEMLQWEGIENAKEVQARRIETARRNAALKLCADIKPAETIIMKRMVAALIEAHEANVEFFAMRRALINQQIGLLGVCELSPDAFLDIPVNRASPLAEFLRNAKRLGYVNSIPAQLR